ncbi:hypothetical protein SARC_11331 [Sphaeroforma arctica JP610]|uniref:Uncharacterized protein n=1 Tax=Sphaeroforma arctica JP610 TaxID=667725 RepID=A0A0L0FHA9_9EUKA|nr:hypothetical protein SARC_11331 [Sphaeroforma arctica JP610]KNC76157.1 hypothetical protein SARC_11331 [Sphaeroforma arctica JP610]|eukprot:XP_014150059.1 hypothetical protein SARC_11331 [Sphaeroforma arctica JP610]
MSIPSSFEGIETDDVTERPWNLPRPSSNDVPYTVLNHPNTDAPIINMRHSKLATAPHAFTEAETLQQIPELLEAHPSKPSGSSTTATATCSQPACFNTEKCGLNIPTNIVKRLLDTCSECIPAARTSKVLNMSSQHKTFIV